MDEVDPHELIQTQRGATAQDDLPGVPMLTKLQFELLHEGLIRMFGQQHHTQAPGSPPAQEALYPPL